MEKEITQHNKSIPQKNKLYSQSTNKLPAPESFKLISADLFNINAFTGKDKLALRSKLVKAGLAIAKCTLCMKAEIISVIVPCGHICLCGSCDKKYSSTLLTLCPICLQKQERKISLNQINKVK